MQEIAKKVPELAGFPPKLRQLGTYMIEKGELTTLKQACDETGIYYQTVKTLIMRCRKKGLDFRKLVDSYVIEHLKNHRPEVYQSLLKGAINGSAAHLKLFAQLTGDLVEQQQVQHEHKIYIATPTGNVIPKDIQEQHKRDEEALKEKQEKIIDVTVIK